MFGFGSLLLLIAAAAVFLLRKDAISKNKLFLKILLFSIPIPYICNTFGWIMTEMGRQPWIVYKVLKLEDAVSKILNPGYILASLIGFILIYGILAGIAIFLVVKSIKNSDKEVLS